LALDEPETETARPQWMSLKRISLYTISFVLLSILFYFILAALCVHEKNPSPFLDGKIENKPSEGPDTLGEAAPTKEWQFVDVTEHTVPLDNVTGTVKLPSRFKALISKVPTYFSRRSIVLSMRISYFISAISVFIFLGCTALAIYSGLTGTVFLDIHILQNIERGFVFASYGTMTAFVLFALLALVALPNRPYIQIACAVIAVITVLAVSGAMLAQLLYRAQSSAFTIETEAKRIGKWLTHFGLGGVNALSTGAFGCWLVMFAVEMILFRARGSWAEPVLECVALPAAFVYSTGSTHMNFFQKLIRIALLIRALLYVLSLIMPLPSFLQ
jgi:hypothetical protein